MYGSREGYKQRSEKQKKELIEMKEKMDKAIEEAEEKADLELIEGEKWKNKCTYITDRANECEKIAEVHSEEMRKVNERHEKEMKEMKETNNKCQQESDKKNIVIEKIQEELNHRRYEAEHHKQKSENIQKNWDSEVNKAKSELKICNDNWERELNKTKSELKISKGKEKEIRKEKLDYQKDYYDMKKKLKTQEEVVLALKKDNEELMSKYMKLKDDKENEMNTSKAIQ